jgi:hypothetical protein
VSSSDSSSRSSSDSSDSNSSRRAWAGRLWAMLGWRRDERVRGAR